MAPVATASSSSPSAHTWTAEATVGVSRTRTFFPELEALRGIAILLVVLFHADGHQTGGIHPQRSLLVDVVRGGHTGVDLFFLLSGFLLALPFLSERWTGTARELRTFYLRRTLRILPLYYAIVVAGALATVRAPGDLFGVLPYFAFLEPFGVAAPMRPWSEVLWSLVTEVHFYLLLPLLGMARARGGAWWWLGAGVLVAWAIAYGAMLSGLLSMPTVRAQIALVHSLVGRGPLFLWGIAAAWLYHHHGTALRSRLAGQRWLRAGIADVLLVVVLLLLVQLLGWVATLSLRAGPIRHLWHIAGGGLWTVVLLLVLLAPLRLKWTLVNPVFGRLGVLSYSIYLLHVPVLKYGTYAVRDAGFTFPGWTPASVTMIAGLGVVCYALASLTYRFIERPFLVRKQRFDTGEGRTGLRAADPIPATGSAVGGRRGG